MKKKLTDLFWENVANSKAFYEWNGKNSLGESVWDLAFTNITSKKFWKTTIEQIIYDIKLPIEENYDAEQIKIFNKLWTKAIEIKIYNQWHKNKNEIIIWKKAFELIQSDIFWTEILKDSYYISNAWKMPLNDYGENSYNTLWHYAVKDLKCDSFWLNVIENKQLYESWNNRNIDGKTVWDYAIKYITNEIFWQKVNEKKLMKKNYLKQITDNKISDKYGGYDFKSKYLKYKQKYLLLKQKINH